MRDEPDTEVHVQKLVGANIISIVNRDPEEKSPKEPISESNMFFDGIDHAKHALWIADKDEDAGK